MYTFWLMMIIINFCIVHLYLRNLYSNNKELQRRISNIYEDLIRTNNKMNNFAKEYITKWEFEDLQEEINKNDAIYKKSFDNANFNMKQDYQKLKGLEEYLGVKIKLVNEIDPKYGTEESIKEKALSEAPKISRIKYIKKTNKK